jgi:hypothetical protein
LASMPGITQLMVSTDVFHEEFIPLECIRNVAVAALHLHVSIQVAVCTRAGTRDSFVERLTELLGPDLIRKVPIGVNPIEPFGRAVRLEDAHWRSQRPVFPGGRCRQINRPAITEDGTVLACCNTCVAGACLDSPLRLGNIHSQPIEEMSRASRGDLIIQAIRACGPKYLAEILVKEGRVDLLRTHYAENDICGLCGSMMSNVESIEILKRAMGSEQHRRDIAISRAVELGELEMLFAMRQ